jgi:hypothetical protein
MRYLSSKSLALVMLIALACTATPATPTPSGPMYSEEEAIAVLKEHLQAKPLPVPGAPPGVTCFSQIGSVTWSAKYDDEGHRWDVGAKPQLSASAIVERMFGTPQPPSSQQLGAYTWSVYERTKSIVATGDEWLNQVC